MPTSIKASFWTLSSHCPAALRMAHFPTPRTSSRPSAGTRSCWGCPACRTFTDWPSRFSVQQRPRKNGRVLPLCFLAFLERTLLSGSASLEECIWAGSFLVAISASLRFADSQHIRWSSLCVSHFTLRGICFRTKTTQRGAPFGLISFGVASSSESWGLTWLPHWIAALDQVWHSLRSRFGPQTDPDCLFFLWNEAGFSPASYSQTLGKLREYLVKSGIPAGQAQQYTLHYIV